MKPQQARIILLQDVRSGGESPAAGRFSVSNPLKVSQISLFLSLYSRESAPREGDDVMAPSGKTHAGVGLERTDGWRG
jgi:hypothetical protein